MKDKKPPEKCEICQVNAPIMFNRLCKTCAEDRYVDRDEVYEDLMEDLDHRDEMGWDN